MERRKKGSGRITYVEDRKSPWRGNRQRRSGQAENAVLQNGKGGEAFLRDINADASKLKALTESGVTICRPFRRYSLTKRKRVT